MAPEVAEVVWYSEDSASPLTVSKPAAFISNDLLIAVIWQHNNPSNQSELTTSADWTLEGNCDGTVSDAKVFSHVYDPSDPSTWAFTYRSTADVCLCLLRITGADQAPVITVTSTPTAATTSSMNSPSLNPGGEDDLLITILGAHGNGSAIVVTEPVGMTDLAQVQVANQFMGMAAAHEALVTSAATGVRTWTSLSPTGQTGGTISISVKSPASSDPLDPIVNAGPPPWLARQIAIAQTRARFTQDAPPPPGAENGTLTSALTTSGTAVKIAACTGRAGLGLSSSATESRQDVYIAEWFSSVQGDGLGNGSAITTARTYAGDRLIVAVTDSQSTTPPTKPGGWNDITLPDNSSGTNFEVFLYELINPAAQTTYTWTVTGGRRTIMGALVRGASTTTLLDEADSLETASSTSHASPSVLTLGPNRAIIAYNVLRGFPNSAWSQASGWLEYAEAVGGDGTTNMQVSLQARTAPTATTYSDTFTCANAEPAIVVLLAVIPTVGGTGATAETGNTQLAVTTTGKAIKVAAQNGQCATAFVGNAVATKKAIAASSTTIAITNVGSETKKSINTGTSYLAITAAETASPRQQTGRTTILLRQTSAEVKIAKPAGTTTVVLRNASTALKIAKTVGTVTTALNDTSVAVKKSIDNAVVTIAITASGAETSGVARQQAGTTALTLRNSATAVKILPATATSVVPLRSAATAVKISKSVGTSVIALRDAATALKKSVTAGNATLALTAVGAETSGVARAQSGSCAVSLRTAGTSLKTIGSTGTSVLSVRLSGSTAKTSKNVGTSTTAFVANGQVIAANVRQQSGTTCVGLRNSSTSTKKSLEAGSAGVVLRCTTDARKVAKPNCMTPVLLRISSGTTKKISRSGSVTLALTVTFTVQVIMENPDTVIRFNQNTTILRTGLESTVIGFDPGLTVISLLTT